MSNIEEYLKNKENDKRELIKQEIIDMLLKERSLDNNVENIPTEVRSLIFKKEDIENEMESIYCWERTTTGFEYRNNFKFDETGEDILFDRYSVTMTNDGFKSDGSEVSDNFLKYNASELESLIKINSVRNVLIKEIDADIERHVDYWKNQFRDYRVKMKIDDHIRMTYNYFYIYGNLGKELLIKWLNYLSDNKKDLFDLLDEFVSDINSANHYFKNNLNKRILRNRRFEYVLLEMLKKYSTRGKDFRSLYFNMVGKYTRYEEMKRARKI